MIRKLTLLGIGLFLIGVIGMMATGFDFGDELPYHEKKWSFAGEELKQLIIESRSVNVDVAFIPSADESGYVEFKGNLEQETFDLLEQASLANGTLKLDFQNKRVIRFLHMQFSRNERQLTVALPRDQILEFVQVKMSSANGSFDHIQAAKVDIETSSGIITVSDLTANQLQLETSSGNINAKDIQAVTKATSKSGNITITNLVGTGKVESHSGNIVVVQQSADALDIESSSGNVTITASSEFSGFYDLQSSSGNIKSPESKRQTPDVIKVRTSSGNIKIKES